MPSRVPETAASHACDDELEFTLLSAAERCVLPLDGARSISVAHAGWSCAAAAAVGLGPCRRFQLLNGAALNVRERSIERQTISL